MLVPAAMFIETAVDQLKDVPEHIRKSQLKELSVAVGGVQVEELEICAMGEDFEKGYELGLQTARVILKGSVALTLVGVKPEDVL